MWYPYIAECENKGLYTGIADDLKRRLAEHRSGKGGHYTSYNRPERILHTEEFKERYAAENREQQVKRWSRAKKLALIRGDKEQLIELSKSRD